MMPVPLVIVGEGQTEETFVRDLLQPALLPRVLADTRLIDTSKGRKGGSLSWDRVRRFLRRELRTRQDTYVTTLFDLYRLDTGMPGVEESRGLANPVKRASYVEAAFAGAIVAEVGCDQRRFIPHIQPYEFEALLFSDVDKLGERYPSWQSKVEPLRQARARVPTPEYINDGVTTHPSALLETSLSDPAYQKVDDGSDVAALIGLDRIRAECRHFDAWLRKLEVLVNLSV